jgi:hypothetical protein
VLYVDIPTLSEFRALAEKRADLCVSLYVPTSPLPQESALARTELRNLAGTAVAQSTDTDVRRARVESLRDALATLDSDDEFWRFQARSLAVLATPDDVHTFRLPNRLTSASVEVADRFYLKPLLRAITFPHEGFVLALSANAVRLVEVFADLPAQSVAVAGLPVSAADAVGRASITERSPRGRLQGTEGQKVLLTQYARQVDAALRPVLVGRDVPVILAALQPLASLFRGVTSIPSLAPETIPASPDRLSDAELASAAQPILDGLYASELQFLRDQFERRRAQGRATRDVAEAARAATFEAIETLLVDIDANVPGTVDELDGRITEGEGQPGQTYGVVDEIAKRALLSGARVLGVRIADLPAEAGAGPLAATLRYPL